MINVSICVDNYLLSQGINSVVDQFFYNKTIFESKNINICSVYDYHASYTSIPNRHRSNGLDYKCKIKQNLKKTFFYKTLIVETLLIMFKRILRGRITCKLFIDRNNSDIFICQDVFMGYFYLKFREKKKRTILPKIVYMTHIHDDEMEQILMTYPKISGTIVEKKMRKIFKYVYQRSDAIVTICNSAKSSLEKNLKNKNIRTIYNSVQDIRIEREPVDYSNIKFVMASSLTERKGMDLLIKILEQLDEIIQGKCEFHIYGDGICFEMLKKTSQKLKKICLKLYGRVERPYRLYGDKDIFLMTSRDECLPMSILEAMSIGMPIFSTNVGAINELIINNVNGILMEPEVNSIVTIIEAVLLRKYNLVQMGIESRKIFLSKFSSQQWCNEFTDLLNAIS